MIKTVSTSELAYELDCSTRTVRAYAARGIVRSVGHGKYAHDESVTGTIKHLKQQIEERDRREQSDRTLRRATGKLREAKTMLLEARYQQEAAALVAASDIKESWGQITRMLDRLFAGISRKIVTAFPHLSEAEVAQVQQMMRDDIVDLELSRRGREVYEPGDQGSGQRGRR